MEADGDPIERFRDQLRSIEAKAATLKAQIAEAEEARNRRPQASSVEENGGTQEHLESDERWPLQSSEYRRYGRQMIMPEIGLEGQLKLKRAKVLIVGLGGLGCPAATYLAGAGVGVLGLVDDDTISLSNLHRQILYNERDVGDSKVKDAVNALKSSNSTINYRAHDVRLTPLKAIELFEQYDLILDCTDHPSSRYFISDAAVLAGKPLVTASALRTEGQLMVLNHPPQGEEVSQKSFCYRCVFPKPPPPESVTTCGEGGILGPVVGVMGVLMAMEAIKVLVPPPQEKDGHRNVPSDTSPSLLMYSAYSNPLFRSIHLKGKRHDCIACSQHATITRDTLESGSLDYIAFCGARPTTNLLSDHERINAHDYSILRRNPSAPLILVDVREPVEFDIAHIPGSVNLPLSLISQHPEESINQLEQKLDIAEASARSQLHFICRLGNDSQLAVHKLRETRFRKHPRYEVKGDIKGGLAAWKKHVDNDFPDYGDFPLDTEGNNGIGQD